MAKIVKPLTNTEVKQAKPKDKIYKLSDGDGLQLRVKTNGAKSWIFNYTRPYSKVRATIGFGSFPEVSLADARKKRESARELIAKDIDPKEYKDQVSREEKSKLLDTLENISSNWFEIKRTSIKEDTAEDIWRSLEIHIFPKLGNYPISKITAPLAIDTLKPIAAKGSLETVKRLTQRLNEIMVYAVNSGLIHANPLSGIKSAFQKPKKQNMPTITPNELPEFLRDLQYASIKLVTRLLIEWQLHTMSRPNEAAGARWAEIDFENKLWIIPPERMKKNRVHKVPLTPQTMAILEMLKPISGHREYLFPADRDPKKHANEQTANAAIKRMGYKGRLVAHGLRSLASTTLNEHGFDSDMIEICLAHGSDNEIKAAYDRAEYINRRIPIMNWWSSHLQEASTGKLSVIK